MATNKSLSLATLLLLLVVALPGPSPANGDTGSDYTHYLGRAMDALEPMLMDGATLDDFAKILFPDHYKNGQPTDKRSLFQLPKIVSAIQNTSHECQAAFYSVGPSLLDTFRGKLPFWIVSMIDATGKFTSGTMRGSRIRMGSYNQCVRLDVDARPGRTPGFRGSMCTVIAEYPKLPKEYRVWELQNNHIYPAKPSPETFEIQVCVPSLCTEKDVHDLVTSVAHIVGEEFVVTRVRCFFHKYNPFSTWTILVFLFLFVLAIFFTLGTLFDTLVQFQVNTGITQTTTQEHEQNVENVKKNMGAIGRSLLAFSVSNNIFYVLTAEAHNRHFHAVEGIRFITLIWVVLANIYYISKDMEWKNYAGLLEDLRTNAAQIILNVRFAAETLFCISGILVSYLTLKQIHKNKGNFNIVCFYVHRILRIIPVYMIGLALAAAFYFHLGEGVTWMQTDEYQGECGKHWWKGLFFINNFFPESEKCLLLSNYVATDFQLYFAAPLFLYPLYGFPKLGMGLLGVEILLVMTIPGILTHMYDLPYFIGRKFYFHPHHRAYMSMILFKPWTHAGPYLIGILYGFILYSKGTKCTMRPMKVAVGWTMSFCIVFMLLFGFRQYIDGTAEMTKGMGILYASTAGTLWAVAIGWIIYACATGYGGFMNEFLTIEFFVSAGKLTFVALLFQSTALHNFLDSRPDVYYYDLWMIIVIFCGSIFTSLVISVILNTLIYEPVRQLEAIWLRRPTGKRASSIVHFAVAPSSSDDEMDESITKLIENQDEVDDDDDDDDMESTPAFAANTNNALTSVDLGKQFKIYQNGTDNKNAEETQLLVVNQ